MFTSLAHLQLIFCCNVCLQEAKRLPATVTGCHQDVKKREKEDRERGEAEKRAPQCVPFFQKSDWLNAVVAVHVKKWAFTRVYNRDYITYTVASLYP